LKLVKATDPVLLGQAPKVAKEDIPTLGMTIAQMVMTMLHERGCGLAAPQVGIPKSLFVYQYDGKVEAVINPVLVPFGDETVEEIEGCLTFPGQRYRTRRAKSILATYYRQDGSRVILEKINDFKAVIFQHETDHLVGRLLPQHGQLEQRSARP
jgi:peptide deformylase